jgi:peptidoglycan-associated lipoprotein
MSRFVMFALLVSTIGCGHEVKVALKPEIKITKKAKKAPKEEPRPASTNIAVTNDLLDACMVRLTDAGKTPKFEFNEFELVKDDKDVLDAVGHCVMKEGPLAGRALQLVGRADERGTQEYNLMLGDKRANTVAGYLLRLGVPKDQISVTSRGDLDSHGRDEIGWRNDRRVDLQLMEDLKVSDAR